MTQDLQHHSFGKPDEVRNFPNGHLELIHTADGEIGRAFFEPGWHWSKDVKPIAETEWCEVPHAGYQVQGILHIKMSNGDEFDIHPGDVTALPPGHDAWVIGDETVISIDWAGFTNYAKPKA